MKALLVTVGAAVALGAGCGVGRGSAEEAWETFNGHLAADDVARAAAMTHVALWDDAGLSFSDDAKEEMALAAVERFRERGDLDFGRGEIRERRTRPDGVVALSVVYPRRGTPGPSVEREMLFKEVGGLWYYYDEGAPPGIK